MIRVIHGDCRTVLPTLVGEGFYSCVCDPPYHLTSIVKRFGKAGSAPAQEGTDGAYARASRGFMGKEWDGGDVAFRVETWQAVRACLRPGAYLAAFGGTRGFHRMMVAIEDAGFEIRDTACWLYGSGFPKSHDVSKAINKSFGAERKVISERRVRNSFDDHGEGGGGYVRGTIIDSEAATVEAAQWAGWGTALKPAWEPIVLARVPLDGTVAGNVLKHGTGGLNIGASRIETIENRARNNAARSNGTSYVVQKKAGYIDPGGDGRWPANVLHDGSDEVETAFAAFGESSSSDRLRRNNGGTKNLDYWRMGRIPSLTSGHRDNGSASRFFYTAKADSDDRAGSRHPTVKPTDLMRRLVRLVTPPGGTVLDPFAGTGSTGLAADQLGMNAVLIEQDAEYVADINRKIRRDAGMFANLE